MDIQLKRVYESPEESDGYRILTDRPGSSMSTFPASSIPRAVKSGTGPLGQRHGSLFGASEMVRP